MVFRPITTTTYLATMEQANATSEAVHFANIDSVRHLDRGIAYAGSYVARLNAAIDQAVGPVKTIAVHRGVIVHQGAAEQSGR